MLNGRNSQLAAACHRQVATALHGIGRCGTRNLLAYRNEIQASTTSASRFRRARLYENTKAIKGSLAEARLIAKMAAKYFGPEAEGPSETEFIIVPDTEFTKPKNTDSKGRE